MNNKSRIRRILPISILILVILQLLGSGLFAQSLRNTENSPDHSLKSNARINPSTLAMELSIPIGGYGGRGGNAMPISFDYSSKVWEMRHSGIWESALTGTVSAVKPNYARQSAAGWTSNLGTPRLIYDYTTFYSGSVQDISYDGQVYKPAPWQEPINGFDLYYIKRLRVEMPDGSSHEFRADELPINCGNINNSCSNMNLSGTFLSVDGSRMRLESGNSTSTLYLPDGSRYLFGTGSGGDAGTPAHTFIDASGNKMTYQTANKRWTDTLGRAIDDPMPINWGNTQSQTVGDVTTDFPGIGTETIEVTLSWRYLKDPGSGESGLENANDALRNLSDFYCIGATQYQTTGSSLFYNSEPNTRICGDALSGQQAPPFNPVVLTKIELANGQSYRFRYNVHGEIVKIVYPTGATERFIYSQITPLQAGSLVHDQANRGVTQRWVSPSGSGTDELYWQYNAGRGLSPAPYIVTITNPDLSSTRQYLHDEPDSDVSRPFGFSELRTGRSFEDRVYSSTGQLLKRNLTQYTVTETVSGTLPAIGVRATRDLRPTKSIAVTFEPGSSNALVQMSEIIYEIPGQNGAPADAEYFAVLNPKQTKTYHYKTINAATAADDDTEIDNLTALFSPSDVATVSEMDYLYDANYKARNISGLVSETRIKDAAGNIKARLQIDYDEAPYSLNSNGSLPTIAAGSWVDPTLVTEFGTTAGSKRGLPTTVKSYSDLALNLNLSIETHSFYDQYGNLRKTRDGKGNESEIQYSADFAFAYPTKTISAVPGGNGSTTAFETTVDYDFNTALPVSRTDANGQTSTVEYNDPLLRPTKTIAPNGHQTLTEYGAGTSLPTRFVKVKTQIDDVKWKEAISWYDGLGRSVRSQSVASDGDVFVDTEYDQFGRAWKTTNPYRTGETVYKTENFYDTAGRLYKVKTPDGAEVETFYSLATTGAQIGTVVTVEDQANKQRRSITNALGQLTRVDEPDVDNGNQLGAIHSPYQPTYYEYDTLGKMKEVTQGVQKRHFLYDSLGRLLRVRQPEQQINPALALSGGETTNTQWSVGMTYDNNGNVLTVTNAKNVTITNTYDALNRVQARAYSDAMTPSVSYTYDDPNIQFPKGKLTKISSSISEMRYTAFDQTGKLLTSEQVTDGQVFSSSYKYNLSGILTEQTYPSGRVVKNFLDNDGDLAAIVSKTANAPFKNYASNFAYTASGVIKHLQIGNGLWESAKMNNRDQVTELNLGTSATDGSLWKLNYDYGELDGNGNVDAAKNSGNIAKQTISVSGVANPFVQIYKYDGLDRIKEAEEKNNGNQMWKQTWDYDRYGNRKNFTQTVHGQILPINSQTLPQIDTNTNRFLTSPETYQYDADGNLIQDGEGRQFIFNGDNKQIEIKDASNNPVGRYYYDGNGKRIKKVTNTETVIFVYDGMGKLAAEYSTAAPNPNPTTNYTATDSLGSPRVITNKQGQIVSRRDFMPFGEEIQADTTYRKATLKYGTGDNIRQKFTGYQRDEESGLDFAEARYYNNNHGRFTAVDPLLASGKSANPQTFNRYAYTMSRPLILTDSTGLQSGQKKEKVIVVPKRVIVGVNNDRITATFVDTGTDVTMILPKEVVQLQKQLTSDVYIRQALIADQNNSNAVAGGEMNPNQGTDSKNKTSSNTTKKSESDSVSGELSTDPKITAGKINGTEKTDGLENSDGQARSGPVTNTTGDLKDLISDINIGITNVLNTIEDKNGIISVDTIDKNGKKEKGIIDRNKLENVMNEYFNNVRNQATCDYNPEACPRL